LSKKFHNSSNCYFCYIIPIINYNKIGTGDNAEEFKCYRIALAHACPYFDGEHHKSLSICNSIYLYFIILLYLSHAAMLSSNMSENNESRIEFPNKDPDEWKIFYPFIDPFQIGEAKHASINDENVMTLVPWFHEFQMNSLHQQCDQFLLDKVLSLARAEKVDNCWGFMLDYSFWDRDMILNSNRSYEERIRLSTMRREAFRDIVKLLEFSCIYDLKKTKIEIMNITRVLLGFNSQYESKEDMLRKTYDLFDELSTVKILTGLFLPLSEEEGTDKDGDDCTYFVSNGKSNVLWLMLKDWDFDDELNGLSLEDINTSSMFPVLVKIFIERCGIKHRT